MLTKSLSDIVEKWTSVYEGDKLIKPEF
jgi:hypothetical protein